MFTYLPVENCRRSGSYRHRPPIPGSITAEAAISAPHQLTVAIQEDSSAIISNLAGLNARFAAQPESSTSEGNGTTCSGSITIKKGVGANCQKRAVTGSNGPTIPCLGPVVLKDAPAMHMVVDTCVGERARTDSRKI